MGKEAGVEVGWNGGILRSDVDRAAGSGVV